MPQNIPLIDAPRQAVITELAGQVCRLTVWWQPNDGGWYASVEYPVGTLLVAGRRLVVGQPLLHPTPSAFAGDLHVTGIPPTTSPLGRAAWRIPTHVLQYRP